MFLLRGFMPERFRYALRDLRATGGAPPPPGLPLDEAMARLAPVAPPEPHFASLFYVRSGQARPFILWKSKDEHCPGGCISIRRARLSP